MAEQARRSYVEVPGDPFLRAIGRQSYRCDAQREAVRAVLSVPAEATVVVNLPTGAGKSLCAQLPALLKTAREGVVIVVVPTTALALDQERAARSWVGHPTAYVGGTSTLDQERNQAIRARVRQGTQRIVFSSPESVLGGLRPAVYHAARQGFLRLLVIDEAHMVELWGDEFRSGFQELAGLRTDLLRHVPSGECFPTVLLTATLNEASLDTLETLFGSPGPFERVSAAQLRPEPSYWSVAADSEEVQVEWVTEALRHLPRPAILYFTAPSVAEDWISRLRAAGFCRTDLVTGRTPNVSRLAALRRWEAEETDLMVATSAFGLGVDQSDVRAVIHATVPESVDRFYQEVGRGGRDGKASLSLLISRPADHQQAASLNRKTIIGIERGRERWTRMFGARSDLGDHRIRVPIDTQPSYRPGDIDMTSDLNRAWNVRTLTLMSRAHLLALDAEAPPRIARPLADGSTAPDDELPEAEYAAAWEEQARHRIVRLLDDGASSEATWKDMVEPIRQRTAESDRKGFALMGELLTGMRCAADIFADAYTIPPRASSRRPGVVVARACGGCPYCRAHGLPPYAGQLPSPAPQWTVAPMKPGILTTLGGREHILAVFYELLPALALQRFVRWSIGRGVRSVVAPEGSLDELDPVLFNPATPDQWVFTYRLTDFRFRAVPALPVLLYLPPASVLPRRLRGAFAPGRNGLEDVGGARILLAPATLMDPARPGRLIRQTLECRTYRFDELSQRIGL